MSDVESMYLDSAENLCTGMNSSDNEDAIESQKFPKQEALKIFSNNNNINNNTFEQHSSSLSSSVSSTSSSSSYLSITTSSPYTTNKNNNFSYFSSPTCKETPSQNPIDRSQSAQDFLNQYNQMWKYTPTHYSSTSLPSSNHPTSTTSLSSSSSNINERNNNATNFVAVALYNNPYLVMNLLQSQQNMALQAALKASLTHNHQVNNEYNNSYQQQQQSSSNAVAAPTTPVIKRKTHLSNCFMQDLSKEGGRFEAFRGEDELEFKSCLYDATNKSNNFEFTQQHAGKFENGQNGPTCHNQENKQPLVRKTKINFGDISELIN